MVPKNKKERGILIEFKVTDEASKLSEKADEALEQIKNKEYITRLKQDGVKEAMIIGLAFHGKDVQLAYLELKLRS